MTWFMKFCLQVKQLFYTQNQNSLLIVSVTFDWTTLHNTVKLAEMLITIIQKNMGFWANGTE